MNPEQLEALRQFLKAEFGSRCAPYDCSFDAQDKLKNLLALLEPTEETE